MSPIIVFRNYEQAKLFVEAPDIINSAILMALLAASFVFLKKHTIPQTRVFDREQTDQLRGLAILFVIIGHFWVHVSQILPKLVFSGDSVALFLMVSGYGLTVSYNTRKYKLGEFVSSRLRRVMFPYWVATALIIVLDFSLLGRTYSARDLALTLIGVNISTVTQHIDYVRWYITFIIFWYVAFFLAASRVKNGFVTILFALAALIFLLNYYFIHLGWSQIAAFPFGCAVGHYRGVIATYFPRNKWCLLVLAFLCLCCIMTYKLWLVRFLWPYVPSIVLLALNEFFSILFSLVLLVSVVVLGLSNYYNSFLLFCGGLSYELFLLHGAFLVKYNFIIRWNGSLPILISFIMFCAFVAALAYAMNKLLAFCYTVKSA